MAKLYYYNGEWKTYQYLHDELGYNTTATNLVTYKSVGYHNLHWGESNGFGYRLNTNVSTEIEYFKEGNSGWYNLNQLALTRKVYPANASDCLMKHGTTESDAVMLEFSDKTLVLIEAEKTSGWKTLSEWGDSGWYLAQDFIIIDSNGQIIKSAAYDGILTFPTTYHTLDDDAEVIFIAPEQRTISFINTEHPEFEVALPATISQDYGSTATLPSVSGTYEDADYTYTPSAWSIGAFGAGITLRNNLVAVLLCGETPIGPVLPTVSIENNFGSYNWIVNGTSGSSVNISSGSTRSNMYISGTTNTPYYNSSKVYATLYRTETIGGANVDPTVVSLVNANPHLGVKNISSETITLYGIRVAVCSDSTATVITVYNSSNTAYNAFKYTANGTDYYYVLDGTQTDWTDDLSSIGYSLYLTAWFASNKAAKQITGSWSGSLYGNNGSCITYDSTKTYNVISVINSSGNAISVDVSLLLLNQGGYSGGNPILGFTNNSGQILLNAVYVTYTMS